LKIRWEASLTHEIDFIKNLPNTKVLRTFDERMSRRREVDHMDLVNISHLEALVSAYSELSLVIEHDVIVNGSKDRLSYRLNLLEVACRYLAAYITLESAAR